VAFGCVTRLALALGLPLTYSYGGARTFGYLAGAAELSMVLIYLAVNLSVFRAFRTGFRAEFRVWRHLVIPAAAVVFFLLSLWGSGTRAAGSDGPVAVHGSRLARARLYRRRRPAGPAAARFEALDRVFLLADDSRRLLRDIECGRGADGITPAKVTTFQDDPAGWSRHGSREDLTA
jgi:hypothetical protein